MQIYMVVVVSLLRFKYLAILCYRAKCIFFHIQIIKVRNFIFVVTLLNLSYIFFPFFLLFNVFVVYLIAQITFITFEMAPIFLVTLFSFLRRTIYSTSKVHYRQFQVLMTILNKKTSCEYF